MALPGASEERGRRFRSVLVSVGHAILGAFITGVVALLVLNATLSFQTAIYDVYYLRMGPAAATETAILGHFLLASVCGVVIAMTVASWLNSRRQNLRAIGVATVVLGGIVLVYFGLAVLGVRAALATLVVLGVGLLAVPLLLRYRYEVRSGSVPAVVGSVPVIVVFLLLAGIGVGWGWGYVMTAEEVPQSSVDGPVADFDVVPTVRDDLLEHGECAERDGRTRCRLQLRGYAHAETAVGFMDRHGVRCPAQSDSGGQPGSFYASHDGTIYRVSCTPHGD